MDALSVATIGRCLIGLIFLVIGIRLLLARGPVAGLLTAKGIPLPHLVVLAGGAIEIVLGVLAVAGLFMPAVGLAMALFVVAATAMVHDFWRQQGPARALEINTVLMHGLVFAGLLILAAYPW